MKWLKVNFDTMKFQEMKNKETREGTPPLPLALQRAKDARLGTFHIGLIRLILENEQRRLVEAINTENHDEKQDNAYRDREYNVSYILENFDDLTVREALQGRTPEQSEGVRWQIGESIEMCRHYKRERDDARQQLSDEQAQHVRSVSALAEAHKADRVRAVNHADKLAEALRDTELRTTQARIASGIGKRKNQTEFLLGELERIAVAARAALAAWESEAHNV